MTLAIVSPCFRTSTGPKAPLHTALYLGNSLVFFRRKAKPSSFGPGNYLQQKSFWKPYSKRKSSAGNHTRCTARSVTCPGERGIPQSWVRGGVAQSWLGGTLSWDTTPARIGVPPSQDGGNSWTGEPIPSQDWGSPQPGLGYPLPHRRDMGPETRVPLPPGVNRLKILPCPILRMRAGKINETRWDPHPWGRIKVNMQDIECCSWCG